MIFYFSGTGNSKGIAELVAQALGDRAVNCVGADPQAYSFTEKDYLGFVFPVYAYAAPEMFQQFADSIRPGGAFTFAICTFSNVAGLALEEFSEHVPLKCGYGIKMPDNYPILNKIIDTKESSMEKLVAAEKRLAEVIPRLLAKEKGFDVLTGDNAHDNTYKLAPMFNRYKRKTAPYRVDKALCTGCGLCEKLCPAKAIELRGERPIWVKEDCCMCMACINRCPAVAIEYGEYSKGKYRYWFKGFDTARY